MKCGIVTESPHVDHVRPRCLFPQLELQFQNLQVLCKSCNEDKGMKIADYRKDILTPKSAYRKKLKDWQFYDREKIEYNSGRSLSKEEIEKLGYSFAE